MAEKTTVPGLLKDKKTGVVINTNNGEYEQILAAREKNNEQNRIKRMLDELNNKVCNLEALIKTHLKV